ncbi:MAG: penicillin-binding transpeptidase domain-containing protein [Eubacterium sp.]|nr:penicillin-binding transpeptidase domain-containing protein [Eubacterium sp.]MCM1304278.1 penicillin-binding transpeptidase domain-containing protein [Butyrivibrio sp.]MCM1344905.1 penicillin-binding transpeptidase domain-containing protein [Muribaculaceae bacterium]MCM1409653.1 penicillin-binding transpeptidase domain-containing protein [Lachnospiraceae bacterium]
MFDEFKDKIISILTSRLTLLTLLFCVLGGVLIYRCFDLQIVHGEEYLNDFILQIEKTRDIASTRGNIYDRNGELLAYNELAYSVKIEDVFESGSSKNRNLNETIFRLIQMVEKNGDNVITDFKIYIDEDGDFAYTAEGTSLLRFLADVYGHPAVGDLDDAQRTATATEVMEYLSGTRRFAIGEYEDPDDSRSQFFPGQGYSREDWLKMVTIRYAMSLTSYRKYIGTTVATNVNERTRAVILENSDVLPGVRIEEDTIRKYVDSKYFAHILGYTGKISSDELTELNGEMAEVTGSTDTYNINDVVGKSGIEAYLETTLQGRKGYEKVVVDNMGKVITILETQEPLSGQDVYLTIDKELTKAVYSIMEQKLAGLVSSKIINAKEYVAAPGSGSAEIKIPIYDVYFAMFNNSIIDMKHMASENADETERQVYEKYLAYKQKVYDTLLYELTDGLTPYNKLIKEYQVYQSNIVTLLNRSGVIMSEAIDPNDATQIAWATDEVISLNEYLKYCIAQNWIDVSKLDLDDKYSDSTEIYAKLLDYIIASVDRNTEFQKRFYKYMLLTDVITGKDVCMILCEQNRIEIPLEDEEALYAGRLKAYDFMMNRITNLDITPAQLALDPCNASVVITDVNTGDVLAMVSYPGYDNNKMANSIDAEYYAQLNADKSSPQLNYATQYKAAPGSTFKAVSATAGLMEGVIDLYQRVNCTGTFEEITPSPRCWRRTGHGNETLVTAIRDSCNYYFYNVGYQLSIQSGVYNETEGLNTLYRYADLFGLTEKSGVEITEYEPDFSNIDPARSAIGQGGNSYTTAGLARYVTTVANGGTCYDLTLIDKITDSEGTVIRESEPDIRNMVELPQEYWNAIHLGMRQVVENKSYFADLAVNVAGKTGTAEQTSSRPNHALFICYAPYEEPEISLTVRIPFGYSSDHAAQAARDIIKYYYGLAEEDELITGTADAPDAGISNEM